LTFRVFSILALSLSSLLANINQLKDSVEFTLLKTGHAFDAFFLVNSGNFFLLPGDRFNRAASEAKPAFGAHFRLDLKF
jgi:hypothetical protein